MLEIKKRLYGKNKKNNTSFTVFVFFIKEKNLQPRIENDGTFKKKIKKQMQNLQKTKWNNSGVLHYFFFFLNYEIVLNNKQKQPSEVHDHTKKKKKKNRMN